MEKQIGSGKEVDYRGLGLLSLGHMMADLNMGALPALLPFIKESLGLSYAMAGTIILCANLTSSVSQPAFGYLTDRKSFLGLLPLGCFCAALGISFLGWASSYGQVITLVAFSGLGAAMYHPEGWRISNSFSGEKKATGLSIFGVGGNLGFAVGPLLAFFLVKNLGLKGSIYFIFGGAAMAAIFLFSRLWRVRRPMAMSTSVQAAPKGSGKTAVYPLLMLLGMVLLRSWTHFGVMAFIPFYYINFMKGDPMQAGNLLFAFLTAGTLGTIAGGPLADRFGHKRVILFSLATTTPLLVLFLLSSGFWSFFWFILAGFILIFSFTISMVMGQFFMPHRLGMVSGLVVGLGVGSGGIGATVLGLVADHWGVPATLWVIAFIPWCALIMAALIPYPGRKGKPGLSPKKIPLT